MACPPVETAPHHGDILADRIEKALAGRADLPSIAFTGTGGTITGRTGDELRAAIWMQVDRLQSWMRGGTRVLVLAFPAGETFVTLFLGCLMAGITAVPVALPRRGSRSGQFRHIVTDCGAAAVLCAPESRATITAALRGADAGGTDPGGGAPQIPVVAWPPDGAALPSLPDIDRADAEKMRPAIIQYTSGSTRWPKGVRIMPWNVVENCALVMRAAVAVGGSAAAARASDVGRSRAVGAYPAGVRAVRPQRLRDRPAAEHASPDPAAHPGQARPAGLSSSP